MKTVAVISPDFTPSSMPNALRVRLLVEHLQEYGWEPVVIATDPQYYEQPADPENEALLRGKYEIIRTRAWPAQFTRRFGLGDVGLRSFYYQWRALSQLCRLRKIDLVFISVPPNYSMALGRLANLRFAVPYVIDYQDPYITDYYKTVPPAQRPPKWRLAYAVAHLVEPFSVRRAAHLVSVDTSYLTGVIQRYKWFAAGDTTGVQLGVEPADFDYIRQHPRENPIFDKSDGLLHISYVGRGGPDILAAAGALFKRSNSEVERRRRFLIGYVCILLGPIMPMPVRHDINCSPWRGRWAWNSKWTSTRGGCLISLPYKSCWIRMRWWWSARPSRTTRPRRFFPTSWRRSPFSASSTKAAAWSAFSATPAPARW